jgi:hypothetical protein
MQVRENMSDAELKDFIKKNEVSYSASGPLYNELIETGYSKAKIDQLIAELVNKEDRSFKAFLLFISFILIAVGVLCIFGFFRLNTFSSISGFALCIIAYFLIRKAV